MTFGSQSIRTLPSDLLICIEDSMSLKSFIERQLVGFINNKGQVCLNGFTACDNNE